jgi:hypothetical protein
MGKHLNGKSDEQSSFFMQLANIHLPKDNPDTEEQTVGTVEYILWMVGITVVLFFLRLFFPFIFA